MSETSACTRNILFTSIFCYCSLRKKKRKKMNSRRSCVHSQRNHIRYTQHCARTRTQHTVDFYCPKTVPQHIAYFAMI